MLGLRPAAAALLAALGAAAGAALSAGRRGYEIEMRGEGSSEEKETKLPSKSEKGTTDKESEEERPLVVDIVAEAKEENCSSARSPAAAVMDADAAVAAAAWCCPSGSAATHGVWSTAGAGATCAMRPTRLRACSSTGTTRWSAGLWA